VDQKSRAAAHVVRARRVQVIAVVHTLEIAHVAKGIGALGKGTHRNLALTRGVVAATARLTTAGSVSINVAAVKGFAVETVSALRVSVRSATGDVVLLKELFLRAWRSADAYSAYQY
jgi:hypothetical protein